MLGSFNDLSGRGESFAVSRSPWVEPDQAGSEVLLSREWLVTNGLGGYASGSVGGACTRCYHGWLIAALPAPLGRRVMLNHLSEEIESAGGRFQLSGEELDELSLDLSGARHLSEFRLDQGLPVWRYETSDVVLEKRLLLPHLQNTVHVSYRLLEAPGRTILRVRASLHFRAHEAAVSELLEKPYVMNAVGEQYEFSDGSEAPPLRMTVSGVASSLVLDGGRFRGIYYRVERRRGYESRGVLWSPGFFQIELTADEQVTLIGSTEPWETILALEPEEAWQSELERRERLMTAADSRARNGFAAELVLAADQFVVVPITRMADAARAYASGDEARTIIAGYHWFTDWGRDTMISLEGLTLLTGRHLEAGYILRTFAHHVRDGLIPNLFPEGGREGLYHTADATLWFFHAVDRYLQLTGERDTLRQLLPVLISIFEYHVRGTSFGIGVDPEDGLLRQGQSDYPLTWMDAKIGDWVVTPRRGKAVEINALWYNALRLLERWVREEKSDQVDALEILEAAEKVRRSFNRRFWNQETGYLFDIVDGELGDDPALRPNQLLAISLPYPVLDPAYWKSVVEVVAGELLTPVGLCTLSREHPDYKPKYDGDLRARDAAYHRGTVWPWLMGPFVDAWMKVHPEDQNVRRFLDGFVAHLGEAGIGSISEIFDAEPSFTPRGCIAQAWSVAEVLRSWIRVAE
ncbi:MAG: glycogen debranching enzyme family protein [Acidobacteria bacterium]|nr:glycogen debranching enzyme family protein [Acidobacteriota bacterium]